MFGFVEPRHQFEPVVYHTQKRVGERAVVQLFELVGVDAAVGGVVLVEGEEGGVGTELFCQLLVAYRKSEQAAES